MSEDIQQLARLIDEASRVVVFTGAGISTESGIPDSAAPTVSGRRRRRYISTNTSPPPMRASKPGAASSRSTAT